MAMGDANPDPPASPRLHPVNVSLDEVFANAFTSNRLVQAKGVDLAVRAGNRRNAISERARARERNGYFYVGIVTRE